jgi:hypothetical protein
VRGDIENYKAALQRIFKDIGGPSEDDGQQYLLRDQPPDLKRPRILLKLQELAQRNYRL